MRSRLICATLWPSCALMKFQLLIALPTTRSLIRCVVLGKTKEFLYWAQVGRRSAMKAYHDAAMFDSTASLRAKLALTRQLGVGLAISSISVPLETRSENTSYVSRWLAGRLDVPMA